MDQLAQGDSDTEGWRQPANVALLWAGGLAIHGVLGGPQSLLGAGTSGGHRVQGGGRETKWDNGHLWSEDSLGQDGPEVTHEQRSPEALASAKAQKQG